VPRQSRPVPALMQATELPRPFHRPGWVYEEKYDGWRMVAEKVASQVSFTSRNGLDHTRRFPELLVKSHEVVRSHEAAHGWTPVQLKAAFSSASRGLGCRKSSRFEARLAVAQSNHALVLPGCPWPLLAVQLVWITASYAPGFAFSWPRASCRQAGRWLTRFFLARPSESRGSSSDDQCGVRA
jgi:hypothetical protein